MHLEMTETDHQNLDTLIDNVLNAHKNGELTLIEARAILAHLVCAASCCVKGGTPPRQGVQFHIEGGKGTRPKVMKFQLRPDPLAR